jgi:hypothetical protein
MVEKMEKMINKVNTHAETARAEVKLVGNGGEHGEDD